MDSSMLVSLLPSLLVCFIITALLLMRMLSPQRTCKLPPGPRGLPLIGHLHLLGKLPHHSLYELSKLHGPLISLRLGSVPVVVASSPEMARQILQTHDLAFANRAPPAASYHIFGGSKDILFSPPNAHWKLMRRLCATELFSTKRLRFFKPVMAEEISVLMQSVLAESIDVNDIDAAVPQTLRPKLQQVTNNIVMRMLLGKKYSELDGDKESHKESIVELLEKAAELVGTSNLGDYVRCIAWMDLQGIERRSKKVGAELRAALEGIIHARRLANRDGRPPNDFLDMLLLQASSTDNPVHIIEVLLDLFVGGTDTSSLIIEWALIELLSNPEKMKLAQAEIDEVVGRARVIDEDDIDHLPFLVACVKETMRLHPLLPLLIPHTTNQACKIADFCIPANTQAYVNVWAIGRDPKIWKNSTIFFPERFLEATSVDMQGQFFELLPFGSGRRMCPGWKLGLVNVHTILATLLQGFEWSIPPSHHLDMSESFHVTAFLTTPLVAYTSSRLPKELC